MEKDTLKNQQQRAIHDVMRSCFNCKNYHSFQGDGDVVCNTYCSLRDEVDFTFTNNIDEKKVANECELYEAD